jgi:putative nucleotidyltransferase with HDIG domain
MTPDQDHATEVRTLVRERLVARVRSGQLEVPVMPHVAAQVLTLTNDPDVSARQFVSLLEQDQQLSARLLKIANSPVYAGPFKVGSIQRAVVVVGLNTLRDLVFSVALGEKVFRSKRFTEPMMRVWEHSLAVGHIAQELAKTKHRPVENAFIAGLLHDIGKPLVLEALDQVSRDLRAQAAVTDELIDGILRDYHVLLGGLVAKVWRFSPELFEAIRFHHDYQAAKEAPELALLTHVANLFARRIGLSSYAADPEFDLIAQPGMKAMGLTEGEIVGLLEKLPKLTHGLVDSFR